MESQETQAAYAVMRAALNERQWRIYLAVKATRRGHGSISAVAREAQTTRGTIRTGITELESGQAYVSGDRIRCNGGGRKSRSSQDPTLVCDLEALVVAKGDPIDQFLQTQCAAYTRRYRRMFLPRTLDSSATRIPTLEF